MRAVVAVLALALGMSLAGPVAPVAADTTLTVGLSAAAAEVSYGGEASFTVTVTSAAGPVAGASVELARTTADGAARVVDYGVTDSSGAVTLTDVPPMRASYVARAEHGGGAPDYAPLAGTSAPVEVEVAAVVAAAVSPVAVPPGGALTLTATTEPAVPGVALVEERLGTGAWVSRGEHPVAADGTVRVELGRRATAGTYTLRVTRRADDRYSPTAAETVAQVTVTGAGSPRAWVPIAGTRQRPAHWGTCRIGYRLNPANMPAHGRADLLEAMRRIHQVSGVRFRYLGTTTRVPFRGDSRAGLNRITVAWGTQASTRGLLAPSVGGVGGTSYTARHRIVTGYLVINRSFAAKAPAGFGEGATHGLVLMHELGHVLGLSHTRDRHQVMYPSSSLPASVWGAGDRRGLQRLGGVGGCR